MLQLIPKMCFCCLVMDYVKGDEKNCTSSPVAALTSGGPAKNIVPCFLTMTDSSAIAGTYAPPAVQEPMTTAI